jgi:hypothetical protein
LAWYVGSINIGRGFTLQLFDGHLSDKVNAQLQIMPNAKQDPVVRRMNIKEIKAKLELLTAKLKDYESGTARCTVSGCKFISDGLRLSQEVEILRKENAVLRIENEVLKKQLFGDELKIPASR